MTFAFLTNIPDNEMLTKTWGLQTLCCISSKKSPNSPSWRTLTWTLKSLVLCFDSFSPACRTWEVHLWLWFSTMWGIHHPWRGRPVAFHLVTSGPFHNFYCTSNVLVMYFQCYCCWHVNTVPCADSRVHSSTGVTQNFNSISCCRKRTCLMTKKMSSAHPSGDVHCLEVLSGWPDSDPCF